MPARFRLKNFQAYEDTEVEVSGLTAVDGPNNAGKSALARAIRASFQNTPSAHLVRRGAPQMEVDVDLGDVQFQWGRDGGAKGRPFYRLGGSPVYPGREVPPQVRDAGIRSVEIGGDPAWPQFAKQGESAFLVDRTGAYLAEAVCDPGRAEQLAQASRMLESDRRNVRGRLSVVQETLRDARGRLAFLSPAEVPAKEALLVPAQIARVEARLLDLERVEALRRRLQDLLERLSYLRVVRTLALPDRDPLQGLLRRLEALDKVRTRFLQVRGRRDALRVVTREALPTGEALRELGERRASLVRLRDRLVVAVAQRAVREVVEPLRLPDAQQVRPAIDRLRALRTMRDHLRSAGDRLRNARHVVEESRAALTVAEQGRDEVVRDTGGCPLCGSTAPVERHLETVTHDPTTRANAAGGG